MELSSQKAEYAVLKRYEALFHSLVDSLPNAIVIYDLSGRATFVNTAFTRIFGYEKEEVLGKPIPYIPDSDLEITEAEIDDLLIEKPVLERETRRLTKDGRLIDVTISASLCWDSQGEPTDLLIMLQALKTEAVGQLAARIGHDFNNLFQVISSYVEILMMNKQEGHPDYRGLAQIRAVCRRAHGLTRQLLKLGAPHNWNNGLKDAAEQT
ncbi:MAG: PAS domain S-box protein [Deltaproteobacteria bacterium]|nr:PAS domain S-box protein [Deltaproteobacteria bacterium]